MIEYSIAMMEKPDCDLCRITYSEYDIDPPCDECVPPLLMENLIVSKIFNVCSVQIGVNNAAVFQIIERYVHDFQQQEYCFELLNAAMSEIRKYRPQNTGSQ